MRGDAQMSKSKALRTATVIGMISAGSSTALGQAAFTDEAITRGVNYYVVNDIMQFGAGVALMDLDNDGDPDMMALGASGGNVGLWENDGTGQFTTRAPGSGIAAQFDASGICAGDYDADGDLDVFISNWLVDDVLYRNDGNFTFTDVTVAAGLGGGICASNGAAWGDYDGDGWLDLYVTARTNTQGADVRNFLYRNNQDGTFSNTAPFLGVDDGEAPSLLMTFLDFDRDGDADIYLGNDKGTSPDWTNHLYENLGDGTFDDITAETGTEANVDCMGIAVGDVNLDGWQDLYVTNTPGGNVLLVSHGDLTFDDKTLAAGVGSYEIGWGTLFFDYDNDRFLDIFVCNMLAENRMYSRINGAWPFTDLASALDLDEFDTSYCVAAGDVDNDGDIDLLVQTHAQQLALHINNQGQNLSWVKFNVVGQGANLFAIGAQVDVTSGGVTQMREVFGGHNYKSQNHRVLHFGLKDNALLDEIVVTWPGGDSRTLTNYFGHQTWTLYPPERMGDANNNGRVDTLDIINAMSCMDGFFEPGCEIFDMDGNGYLDFNDIVLMGLEISNRYLGGVKAGP